MPRRIDHILVNQTARELLKEAAVIEDADTHPHLPIYSAFVNDASPALDYVNIPCALKTEEGFHGAEAEQWLASEAPKWDTLMAQDRAADDMASYVVTLSRKWEAYLRVAFDSKLQGGRGKLAEADSCKRPKQTPAQYAEQITKEFLGYARARARGEMDNQRKLTRLANQCVRRWPHLVEQFGNPIALLGQPEDLQRCARLWKDAAEAEERRKRKNSWKERLALTDLKDLCACIKQPRLLPPSMCNTTEGWTSDPVQLLATLKENWRPIMMPEDPQVMKELEDYLAYLPAQCFEWQPLDVQEVKEAALRMKTCSVPGADGWRVKELRRLPHGFYVDLTHLFNYLEGSDKAWPRALRTAWIAAVPKKSQHFGQHSSNCSVTGAVQDVERHARPAAYRVAKCYPATGPKCIPHWALRRG